MLKRLRARWNELSNHPAYRRNRARVLGRTIKWALHCLFRIPAHARFRRWKFSLYIPPIWKGGGCTTPFIFREDYSAELLVLERFLGPGMTFVDGGANIGIYTFVAASLVASQGHVLAFEPGEQCFRAMERSRELNQCSQVILRRQGLSDRCEQVRLYHHRDQPNSYGLGTPGDEVVTYEEIEVVTLQQALSDENLSKVDFLKLDVEGAQEQILRHSIPILERDKPVLLVEVDKSACERLKVHPEGAWEVLSSLGYRSFSIDEKGEIMIEPNPKHLRTFLAVHESYNLV